MSEQVRPPRGNHFVPAHRPLAVLLVEHEQLLGRVEIFRILCDHRLGSGHLFHRHVSRGFVPFSPIAFCFASRVRDLRIRTQRRHRLADTPRPAQSRSRTSAVNDEPCAPDRCGSMPTPLEHAIDPRSRAIRRRPCRRPAIRRDRLAHAQRRPSTRAGSRTAQHRQTLARPRRRTPARRQRRAPLEPPRERMEPEHAAIDAGNHVDQRVSTTDVIALVQEHGVARLGRPRRPAARQDDARPEDADGHGCGDEIGLEQRGIGAGRFAGRDECERAPPADAEAHEQRKGDDGPQRDDGR